MNNFQKMIQEIKLKECKEKVSVGEWHFVPYEKAPGSFIIFYKNSEVIAVKDYKITDVMWGYSFKEDGIFIECYDILKQILSIPNVYINVYEILTNDGLAALGYWNATHLMSLDEEMHLDYELGWYASKPGKEKDKKDFILFWDRGNSWCDVEKEFENLTNDEFLHEVKKYIKEKYGK